MRRWLAPLAALATALALVPAAAHADETPSPTPSVSSSPSVSTDPSISITESPTPSPSSEATPTPTPTPTPRPLPSPGTAPAPVQPPAAPATQPPATPDPAVQRLIDETRVEIGSGVADSLAAAQRLSEALDRNTSQQEEIQQRIESGQARIDALDDEIERLSGEIDTTQQRIDTERAQIAVLARELYQQPDSLLLRLLQAGSLRDMVTLSGDLAVAALRADALRQHLTSDLAKLKQDQQDRQAARNEQSRLQDQLTEALPQLAALAAEMEQTSDALQSAIEEGQDALDGIGSKSASLAKRIAAMLRQRQDNLIATAERQVWQQAQLWATLNASALPSPDASAVSRQPSGARFAWPLRGAVLTQGYGPTELWLEPAMFGFVHFHTGLDLASPDTTVTAAADGVVAAVGSGTTGYGNYVIIVHAGGLVTLYAHLAETMAQVGQRVTAGQQIGVEGSTGASTGVHLHFEVRIKGAPVDPSPFLVAMGSA